MIYLISDQNRSDQRAAIRSKSKQDVIFILFDQMPDPIRSDSKLDLIAGQISDVSSY